MRALTICQPYAHLICLPDDHPRAKRVENRRWGTQARGLLLIHAGKSRNWLDLSDDGTRDEEYDIPLADMAFGAIVGVANLADCFHLGRMTYTVGDVRWNDKSLTGGVVSGTRNVFPAASLNRFPWLTSHEHVEGPFCFVLTECRRFETPIPYRGAQGFFDVPREVVAEQLRLCGAVGV